VVPEGRIVQVFIPYKLAGVVEVKAGSTAARSLVLICIYLHSDESPKFVRLWVQVTKA